MPVLYGVFLFMGVSSLVGVQLMQRISIVFMPPKYQPDYIYLRHVPLRRVHLFTLVQVSKIIQNKILVPKSRPAWCSGNTFTWLKR